MSITRTSTTFCDAEGCPRWAGETVGTAADSRAIAKTFGWTRRDGKDLCPQHRALPPGSTDGGEQR